MNFPDYWGPTDHFLARIHNWYDELKPKDMPEGMTIPVVLEVTSSLLAADASASAHTRELHPANLCIAIRTEVSRLRLRAALIPATASVDERAATELNGIIRRIESEFADQF